MKTRLLVPAVALMLALSGCATETPEAQPTPLPTPSETVSATAEPTPEPTRPSVAELALAPGSLNLLVVGQPAPSADDPTAMIEFDPEGCVAEELNIAPGDPNAGLWSAVPEYFDAAGDAMFRVGVNDSGALTAIQVSRSPAVKTTEGIGIGSTVTELLSAYPAIDGPIDAGLTQLYVSDAGEMRLVFEVSWAGGIDYEYWADDEVDRVVVMTAQLASVPAYGIWGTDGGVGGCLG